MPKPAVPVVPSAVEVTDPPVKKTVVVPKNAHIPIRQDVRNIFDRQVCKGINWNEGGGGRVPKHNVAEQQASPEDTRQKEKHVPDRPDLPPFPPLRADARTDADRQDEVPDWVQKTLAEARTA